MLKFPSITTKKLPIFWWIFPSFIVLSIIPLIAFTWYSTNIWREFYIQQVEVDLKASAKLIYAYILDHAIDDNYDILSPSVIDPFLEETYGTSDTRITIISPSGHVIYDTKADHLGMGNQLNKPEILALRNSNIGSATRYSKTLSKEMMYVAIPLKVNNEIVGIIRTSLPLNAIRDGNLEIFKNLLLGVAALSLFIIITSLLITKTITNPLGEMKIVAEILASGMFYKELKIPKTLELASLAQALNKMATKLEIHIDTITETNLNLTEEINSQKNTELELLNAYKALEEVAITDAVTHIANRYMFDKMFASEWKRMQRENSPLSLILIDIDCFKFYNDHYGHHAGDQCLFLVAKTISTVCHRTGDLVARFGGEEFIVLLPNTDPEGALSLAEHIRKAIADLKIPHVKSTIAEYVTISLGTDCIVPNPDIAKETFLAKVDKALYAAKNSGKNRVVYLEDTDSIQAPTC